MTEAPELVVLLDEAGNPIGTMDKRSVHTVDTPLHLAFSYFGLDQDGRVLFTRRALGKRTWPGVWTGTCCGHPAPGEDIRKAIERRMRTELGLRVSSIREALPDFRYRAVAPDGVVENEICPVYLGEVAGELDPDPDEVMDWQWVRPADLLVAAAAAPFLISPWSVLQLAELSEAGLLA